MQRDPVSRFRPAQVAHPRLETATEVTEAGLQCLGEQDFVEAAGEGGHAGEYTEGDGVVERATEAALRL